MVQKLLSELSKKSVAVIGVGGLGGYVASSLARAGVGKILLVDGDVFCESNLDRQLYCNSETLQCNKASATKRALEKFATGEIVAVEEFFDRNNADKILDVDLAVDALDNVKSRFILQEECAKRNVAIVHGSIDGLFGEVALISPNSKPFESIYANKDENKAGKTISFVPAVIGNLQAGLAINYLAGSSLGLQDGELMLVNLLDFSTTKVRV